jgi:hypothetical protein
MTESFSGERLDVLKRLVECSVPLDDIARALRKFEWDYDGPVFVVTRLHVVRIAERYLKGDLSASTIELWANLLEGRDDISFESGYEKELSTFVYELANPLLVGSPDHRRATEIIDLLRKQERISHQSAHE